MSDFHYVRLAGDDGGVEACEGEAIGLDLQSILSDGLPPIRIALEIIAGLCEILDIADQDGEVHGDVHPRYVFIDEGGALSLEGFGQDRTTSGAPEGRPLGGATDRFGLGYVAYRLLCARDDLERLPKGEGPHEDAVIDAVIAMNFEDFPESIVGDIQWFVAKLLAHDPAERPAAVDAWRTFIAFAGEMQGPVIQSWAEAAVNGGGERRDRATVAKKAAPPPPPAAPVAPAPEPEEEDLGGPVRSSGPLAKGAINFGGPGGKPGQATAFWSRDEMKAALKEAEEEEAHDMTAAAAASRRPAVGGGAATAFWTPEQLKAMAEGGDAAPRPKRGGGAPRPQGRPPAAPPPPTPAAPPLTPAAPPPKPPPPAAGPVAPVAVAPVATPPAAFPAVYPKAPEPETAAGGGPSMALLAGLALLVLLCGGFVVLGGGLALFASSGDTGPAPVKSSNDVGSDTKASKTSKASKSGKGGGDTAEPKGGTDAATAAPAPVKPPTKPPATTTTPPKSTSGSSRPRTSSRKPAATTTAPVVAPPVRVTFMVPAKGNITCGDGQSSSVDGSATMTFEGAALPASCMVSAGGGRWAGMISKGGSVRCTLDGAELSCTGP